MDQFKENDADKDQIRRDMINFTQAEENLQKAKKFLENGEDQACLEKIEDVGQNLQWIKMLDTRQIVTELENIRVELHKRKLKKN